jgi:RAMP superfamily
VDSNFGSERAMSAKHRRHRLAFKVHVRSPFIFAGLDPCAVGVDTSALRNEDKLPVLPGDHLKGLLRQALETIELVEKEHRVSPQPVALTSAGLFGPPFDRDADDKRAGADRFAPRRGLLLFGDLTAKEMLLPGGQRKDIEKSKTSEITRIEIDDDTGVVARGMLQVIELAAPLAAVAEFTGEALFYGTDEEAKSVAARLGKALRLIPYFGGLRSAGFGEHVAEDSCLSLAASEDIVPTGTFADSGERFTVTGTFDRPFLVAAHRLADNVSEGSEIIPGGAIKGAIANMLARADICTEVDAPHGEVLSRMRISHAFPLDKTEQVELGRSLPLSAMLDPLTKNYRCAFEGLPGLIDNRCADFQPDWKPADLCKFANKVGRPSADLPRLARGHTKIDSETGVATDQALFVEVARGVLLSPGKRRLFRFTVDFRELERDDKFADAIRDIKAILSTGVDAVGKTNARFVTREIQKALAQSRTSTKRRWRLLLETPGILADADGEHANSNGTPREIGEQLRDYFETLVPGAKLKGLYTQRRYAGGYPALRRPPGGGVAGYRPFSLFVEGTAFLLEADEANAPSVEAVLAELEQTGLPAKRWNACGVLEPFGDWQVNPYLPENGYGAISVEDEVFDRIASAGRAAAGESQ